MGLQPWKEEPSTGERTTGLGKRSSAELVPRHPIHARVGGAGSQGGPTGGKEEPIAAVRLSLGDFVTPRNSQLAHWMSPFFCAPFSASYNPQSGGRRKESASPELGEADRQERRRPRFQ